jgi:hypothetical protein
MILPRKLYVVRIWLPDGNISTSVSRVDIREDGSCEIYHSDKEKRYQVEQSPSGTLTVRGNNRTFVVDGELVGDGKYLEGWYSTVKAGEVQTKKYFPYKPSRRPYSRYIF